MACKVAIIVNGRVLGVRLKVAVERTVASLVIQANKLF